MALTAQDVESQVFRQEFRGYNQEEVDAFLDLVSARLVELTAERDHLAERVSELERGGPSMAAGGGGSDMERLSRTLIMAERTAEETVNEARTEAQQLLEEARLQAQQSLDDAREEAERTVQEARHEASAERQDSAVLAQRVHRATDELRRFHDDYRERVQAVIAEQLAVLDRISDLPTLSSRHEEADRELAGVGQADTGRSGGDGQADTRGAGVYDSDTRDAGVHDTGQISAHHGERPDDDAAPGAHREAQASDGVSDAEAPQEGDAPVSRWRPGPQR